MVRINQLIEHEARISKGVIRQDPVVVRKVFGFILRATGDLKSFQGETPLAAVWALGSREASDMREIAE